MIVIVVISFTIIALMDMPDLVHAGYKWDLTVYLVIYIFALVLFIMLVMGVYFPSPTLWFEHIIKDVMHLNYA